MIPTFHVAFPPSMIFGRNEGGVILRFFKYFSGILSKESLAYKKSFERANVVPYRNIIDSSKLIILPSPGLIFTKFLHTYIKETEVKEKTFSFFEAKEKLLRNGSVKFPTQSGLLATLESFDFIKKKRSQ